MATRHSGTTRWAAALGLLLVGMSSALADSHWKPVADSVYLQEVGSRVITESPVTGAAVHDGSLYVIMDGAIHTLKDNTLVTVADAPGKVFKLVALDGALWALGEEGLYRFADSWKQVSKNRFVDVCLHAGAVHAATREDIFRYENGTLTDIEPATGYLSSDITVVMEDGSQVLADPVRLGPVDHLASYCETLYFLRPDGIVLFDGAIVDERTVDWGALPSPVTRDLHAQGSRLYVATAKGLGELRGMNLITIDGDQGLPYEDTTCLADGFDGDLWIGTTRGAIRKVGDDYHYFGAELWLPGDRVNAIAVGGRTVYVATDKGLGIIDYEPYTLRKKAAYYERHLDEWGHKRLGFIHKLYWGGEENGWIREISDNDGGHTSPYLAAMALKYAVTGDDRAREEAVDAFKAMLWLETITPKSGFFARAIWSTTADKHEKARHGSGGLPAKWYPTDDGLWYWKGDTSSDEAIAHYYSVSLFHDLAAKGPEKARAAEHLRRISTHIIDNGWVLRDMDGKPTRWGRWDPQYLLAPYGSYDRGLNALEVQAFIKSTHAVTGDPVFEKAFNQLLEWNYHQYTLRQKNTFPPHAVVPWDDELAFKSYYTLLRYVKDPALRSTYVRSLARTFEVKREEGVAWYNYVYGALTGNDCESDRAAQYLREYPLDMRSHSYQNSHRADLAPRPGFVPHKSGRRGLSPREMAAERGGRPAHTYDGGAGGRAVVEPVCWLMDYWLGRYHGFIEAPTTTDPELISVPHRPGLQLGAEPYAGPGRPKDLIPGE